jgi:hypothetical protein
MKHEQARSDATSVWRVDAINFDSSCTERCVISRITKLTSLTLYTSSERDFYRIFISLLTSSMQIKDAKRLILICMWFGCGAGLTLLASSKIEWYDSMILNNQHPDSFSAQNFLITLMADIGRPCLRTWSLFWILQSWTDTWVSLPLMLRRDGASCVTPARSLRRIPSTFLPTAETYPPS